MYTFPTFPMDEAAVLIGPLRGQPIVDIPTGIRCGSVLIAYGTTKIGSAPAATHVVPAGVISEVEAAALLEIACSADPKAAAAFPWETMLPILLGLISKFLERRKAKTV